MELTVHGKQLDVGDALRAHVQTKLDDIDQKYFNHATTATVTFSKEGHGHGLFKAHISYLVSKNIMVVTEAEESDPYVAFDSAAAKAAKQLRRNKRRLRDNHARSEKTPEAEIIKAQKYVLAQTPDTEEASEQDNESSLPDDAMVIAEMTTHIETLSVPDALMRLDLSNLPALLFYNASHKGLNMLYRRADGNVGWVDPDGAAATQKIAAKK